MKTIKRYSKAREKRATEIANNLYFFLLGEAVRIDGMTYQIGINEDSAVKEFTDQIRTAAGLPA